MVYDINGNEICSNERHILQGDIKDYIINSSLETQSGESMMYEVTPCQRIFIDGAASFIWLKTNASYTLGNESLYFRGWNECDENGADLYAAPDCHYLMVIGNVNVYAYDEYKDFALHKHDLLSIAAYMSNLCVRMMYGSFVRNKFGNRYQGALTGVGTGDVHTYRTPAAFVYDIVDVLDSSYIDYGLIGTTRYALINQCKRYLQALVDSYSTWSGHWQSSLVMAYLASAAYRIKDDISSSLYSSIQDILIDESDILINKTPGSAWKSEATWTPIFNLYWKNSSGTELTSGDSKSEEVAWYSTCLGLAALMCPDAPNNSIYKSKFVEWCIISHSSPSDIGSAKVVNGYPLANLEGSNMTDDGIVINHNMIHPDYMNRSCHFICMRAYAHSKTPIPRAITFNMDKLLHGYVDYQFTSDKYLGKYIIQPPYGTIIKDGDSNVYFPMGNDWGSERYQCEAEFLAYCYAWGINPRYDCSRSATILLERFLALQDRFVTGSIVNSTSENSYSTNMYDTNVGSAYISPIGILWVLTAGFRWTDEDWWTIDS